MSLWVGPAILGEMDECVPRGCGVRDLAKGARESMGGYTRSVEEGGVEGLGSAMLVRLTAYLETICILTRIRRTECSTRYNVDHTQSLTHSSKKSSNSMITHASS